MVMRAYNKEQSKDIIVSIMITAFVSSLVGAGGGYWFALWSPLIFGGVNYVYLRYAARGDGDKL